MNDSPKTSRLGFKGFIKEQTYSIRWRIFDALYELNERSKVWYKKGNHSSCVFSRFLNKSEQTTKDKKTLKWLAFKHDHERGELSVYETTQLTRQKIVAIGKKYVDRERNSKVYGYTRSPGNAFLDLKLGISYNNFPKWHANIIKWPSGQIDSKEKQMAIAKILASKSDFVTYDPI